MEQHPVEVKKIATPTFADLLYYPGGFSDVSWFIRYFWHDVYLVRCHQKNLRTRGVKRRQEVLKSIHERDSLDLAAGSPANVPQVPGYTPVDIGQSQHKGESSGYSLRVAVCYLPH
ncbi:MAG TPA: hypothetical protein DGR97_08370 [Gammaproteobacteria bacterium]|nr:hypothetical protein [Gammaproteobacteria bacterium]